MIKSALPAILGLALATAAQPVTFDEAKNNEEARQALLDEIFTNRYELGGRVWGGIGTIMYDPGLRKIRGLDEDKVLEYVKGATPMASVRHEGPRGIPCPVGVSESMFEFGENLDDLLSIIDNEAISGYGYMIGAPFMDLYVGDVGDDIKAMIAEIFSFEYQFARILDGTRNVSPRFRQSMVLTGRAVRKNLEEYAKDPQYGHMAREYLEVMKSRDTWEFFKPETP
jgi:hypothetical protein